MDKISLESFQVIANIFCNIGEFIVGKSIENRKKYGCVILICCTNIIKKFKYLVRNEES